MEVTRQRKRSLSEGRSTDESDVESDHTNRKSGKWTIDEENFANQLITEFETGSLRDCADGSTLRSYLAKKLNCAPMRISKKFAGRCIGKHVFSKRDTVDGFSSGSYYSASYPMAHSPDEFQSYSAATSGCDSSSETSSQYQRDDSMCSASDEMDFAQLQLIPATAYSQFQAHLAEKKKKGSAPNGLYKYGGYVTSELDLNDAYQRTYEECDCEAEEWMDVLNFFCGGVSNSGSVSSSGNIAPAPGSESETSMNTSSS